MTASLLLTVGSILLLVPAVDAVAHRTRIPRVTLLIGLGVALGPMAMDVLPEERTQWYPLLVEIALAMVGFLLGGEFTLDNLREQGRAVLAVSGAVTIVTALVVSGGLWLLGTSAATALVLGTAATATDPAAVDSVCRDREDGPTSSLLRGIVAVDDVWGMLLFALVLSALGAMTTGELGTHELLHAVRELGGSIALGGVLGLLAAAVSGRLQPGEPTRLEALGSVLLCCGLASYFGLSYLLAAVTMGAVVASTATHHETAFHELEAIETPFLVLFFVLSAASASPAGVREGLWLVAAYVALRTVGRLVGGWVGARAGAPERTGLLGLALLPQAGVALGMTMVAVERAPELAPVLPVVVVSTVLFESLGPMGTAWVLDREG